MGGLGGEIHTYFKHFCFTTLEELHKTGSVVTLHTFVLPSKPDCKFVVNE